MKKIVFLLLLFPMFCFAQVEQIGSDIDAEAALDFFGFSTAISSNGNIVAIGAPFNDGVGTSAGHVQVYENQGGTWVQIGEDIDGEGSGDNFGRSVAISSDGTIVAAGADKNGDNGANAGHVRIFENQGGTWVQIGDDIDGEAAFDFCGISVALSGDGNIVAVGAPENGGNGNNSGHVRLFENIGGNWLQIGQPIEGEAEFDFSSGSISLSEDGTTIAIGAEANDDNGEGAGQLRIFRNMTGVWTQIGLDINGTAELDFFGRAVSLSADGKTVASAAGGSTDNASDAGYVQVFVNVNDSWVQVGQDIVGEAEGDGDDASPSDNISLSDDGRIIAIGARSNDGNGEDSGHVRIFAIQGDTWEQVGDDIDGEMEDDLSGHSVSLSGDGSTLAIGARDNDGTGNKAGHVRVFSLDGLISSTSNLNEINFGVFPNPVSDQLTIELDENSILKKATIFNNLGQLVKTSVTPIIDTSDLPKGMYVIEVSTKEGMASKKFVVE